MTSDSAALVFLFQFLIGLSSLQHDIYELSSKQLISMVSIPHWPFVTSTKWLGAVLTFTSRTQLMQSAEERFKEKFVGAVAFCLRHEGHGGDIEAIARWALLPEDKGSAPGDENLRVALVSGGATRIKSYVFESARLPEIRGASGLLDRINTRSMRRLW